MTSWGIHSISFQIVYFVSAMTEVFLFANIVFGWASIEVMLKEEGFFSYLCSDSRAVVNGTNSTTRKDLVFGCKEQNDRLNLVFNVAFGFSCFAQPPAGYFNDRFGPRAAQALGCLFYVIAGVGQAFMTKETSFLLFPVFILFSCGGSFIAYAKYFTARVIYTSSRSVVLSMLSGSFDASAGVPILLKLMYDAGITLRGISLFYSGLCLALVSLSGFFLTPQYSVLREEAQRVEPTISREEEEDLEAVPKNIVPESFLKSVFSIQFMLELMSLCICQLRLLCYVGNLESQIIAQSTNSKASINNYLSCFTYIQFCGLAVGPITGMLFDRNTISCCEKEGPTTSHVHKRIRRMKESVLPFLVTNLCCVMISLFSLVPGTWALVLSFVLIIVTRALLYGSHASFVAIAFRPEWFATLNSLGMCIGGVFGLLQYPLHSVTQRHLEGNPFWINVILLVLTLAMNSFPLYLWYICKRALNALSEISSFRFLDISGEDSLSKESSELLRNAKRVEYTRF